MDRIQPLRIMAGHLSDVDVSRSPLSLTHYLRSISVRCSVVTSDGLDNFISVCAMACQLQLHCHWL